MGSSAEMRRYLEGDEELYLYTRYANPTVRVLEEHLAALEEGEAALALASGMAAATTGILSLLEPGDEVLASASLYGGTARFVRDVLPRFGFGGRVVPVPDLVKVASLAGERTRVIVRREPHQPHGGDRGPRGGGGRGPRSRDRGLRRQHLRHAGGAAAAEAGRRPRDAQPQQGAGRPQRHHRRRARRIAGAHRQGARAAEGARGLHRSPHRVPRRARAEDRPPARAAAVRERDGPRHAPREAPEGAPRRVPRPGQPSRARGGAPPDVRLRRGGGLRARGGAPGGGEVLRRAAARVARGQPGRRRVADQPARAHVALRVQRRAARGGRASTRARRGSPSGSRTPPTSSPTSSARWSPSPPPDPDDPAQRDDAHRGAGRHRGLLLGAARPRPRRLPALPPDAAHGRASPGRCGGRSTSRSGWAR